MYDDFHITMVKIGYTCSWAAAGIIMGGWFTKVFILKGSR